jgi:hypothetical protein
MTPLTSREAVPMLTCAQCGAYAFERAVDSLHGAGIDAKLLGYLSDARTCLSLPDSLF